MPHSAAATIPPRPRREADGEHDDRRQATHTAQRLCDERQRPRQHAIEPGEQGDPREEVGTHSRLPALYSGTPCAASSGPRGSDERVVDGDGEAQHVRSGKQDDEQQDGGASGARQGGMPRNWRGDGGEIVEARGYGVSCRR